MGSQGGNGALLRFLHRARWAMLTAQMSRRRSANCADLHCRPGRLGVLFYSVLRCKEAMHPALFQGVDIACSRSPDSMRMSLPASPAATVDSGAKPQRCRTYSKGPAFPPLAGTMSSTLAEGWRVCEQRGKGKVVSSIHGTIVKMNRYSPLVLVPACDDGDVHALGHKLLLDAGYHSVVHTHVHAHGELVSRAAGRRAGCQARGHGLEATALNPSSRKHIIL